MRLGIMAMQKEALVPAGLTPADAMAHIRSFDHAGLVRRLAGFGFDPIELGGDKVLFFPHAFAPATVEQLAQARADLGITYTVHLPLWSVEPSTPLTPVRLGSVRSAVEVIRATRPLAPEVYVFHATGALAAEFYRMELPEQARWLILRQFQAQALASLRAILEETGLPPRQLAIETVEFPFELTLELAEALDLAFCLDTGHVLSGFSGPVDLFDVLEACLPRLAEIHLHDSPAWQPGSPIVYGQDHHPLGTGALDTARLLDRLAAAAWNGPIIFELTVPEALASREIVRRLRPDGDTRDRS